MPSSISSSKNKINNWWLTWLLSLVLLLLAIGLYESFLFKKGFKPSIEVSKDLWSWNRKAASKSADVIALVGASRIQLGLNTNTLRTQLPQNDIVVLAINGQYPMATIKGLAEDKNFNGVVLMSFMAQMLEPQYEKMQTEYNQYYQEKSSLYLSFDAYLTAALKSRFRFLHPLLGLHELVNYLGAKKSFPEPFYVNVHPDTSAAGDYSMVDAESLKRHFIVDKQSNYEAYTIMDKTTWLSQVSKLSADIKTIQDRGGEVVLVRFPTADEHWVLDELYYPRAQFWDTMVAEMPHVKTLHFKDDALLSSFELPDSSHLDISDTQSFTLRLIELLKTLQIFSQP
ncbi:hypothetical protein [Marinicella litoralis]|uniref:Uncharacterized protein n=1 Tax=Marinicella litoralis TaxID=644220 RepID=A0A4V3DH55_9GAMM|nr:hypothetical protein [Marinicella litoralis]TDR16871.1 hypothetical protein C8D91_2778 [Marinicella litoralis]